MKHTEAKNHPKKIIINFKNRGKYELFKDDFKITEDFIKYSKYNNMFKNNNKYTWKYFCYCCMCEITTYHWIQKCPNNKRTDWLADNENLWTVERLYLEGYWDQKNIMKRHAPKPISRILINLSCKNKYK